MNQRLAEMLVIPMTVLFIGTVLWLASQQESPPQKESRPDFSAISDVKVRKATFFEYMLPKVRGANERILAQRARLLFLLPEIESGTGLTNKDKDWIHALSTEYRVQGNPLTSTETLRTLEKRVDVIPVSLALAQAANESAWGTARFAKNGNNFFGIWCWVKNCGMIPTQRDSKKKHEVASFDNVEAGVRYYMLTLNSHPAYKDLRERRHKSRKAGAPITGMDLAEGLQNYSERGGAYVKEIRAMIRFNKLQRYNLPR